jgi:glucose/arabinose dehydrogenase
VQNVRGSTLISRRIAGAAVAVLALTACGGDSGTSTSSSSRSSTTAAPTASATPAPSPTADPCVPAGAAPPAGTIPADLATALAFAPDGRLFYAERGGRVVVYQGNAAHVFATVSTVTTESNGSYSERGLLGLALSPTFTQDHFVYAFYSLADYQHQVVVRWHECAGVASDERRIIELPAGSDCCHKGGRIAFGADGKLYVTLGDEHAVPRPPGGPNPTVPQDTSDVRGKVLRYNADGTIPADNPFGPNNLVWAYGLRNPFGIAFAADGTMVVTNNGPTSDAGSPRTGYDTVVTIVKGRGYQWPVCYGYSHPIAPYGACPAGQSEPDWSSETSTVVPTGATFVDASGPAPFAGHLVFCNFARGMLILTPGSPHATVSNGPGECTLDVKQGPDHALYYSDSGHIYRRG